MYTMWWLYAEKCCIMFHVGLKLSADKFWEFLVTLYASIVRMHVFAEKEKMMMMTMTV